MGHRSLYLGRLRNSSSLLSIQLDLVRIAALDDKPRVDHEAVRLLPSQLVHLVDSIDVQVDAWLYSTGGNELIRLRFVVAFDALQGAGAQTCAVDGMSVLAAAIRTTSFLGVHLRTYRLEAHVDRGERQLLRGRRQGLAVAY